MRQPVRVDHRFLLLAAALVSLALHLYVFRLDLVGIHVWRQTKTQQVINNFYLEDFNILHPRTNNMSYPGRLLLQEFPLMQWLFACVYKLFGPHIVISRLLSFVVGVVCIFGMYRVALHVLKEKVTAALTAWAFCFSPVFHYYMVNPMPDNFALCLGVWALARFMAFANSGKRSVLIQSAVLFGLSALVKLPFVLFVVYPAAWFFHGWRSKQITGSQLVYAALVFGISLLPAAAWYGTVVSTWGSLEVLGGIIGSHKSFPELLYIFQGTVVSVLPELLLNYAAFPLFVAGLWVVLKRGGFARQLQSPLGILALALCAYYLYEMAAIDTVHDYYLLPFLPLLFLIVGAGIRFVVSGGVPRRWQYAAMACLALMPITAFIRCYSRWDVKTDTGFERVFYDHKELIRAATPKDALCVVGADQSDMVLLYYADRVGWSYGSGGLDEATLTRYISQGAAYLYATDNVPEDPSIKSHLDKLVLQQGNLRIYRLHRN